MRPFFFLLACAAAITSAQGAITRFDIPAQPLADSLRAVGTQASVNLLFDPPLVAGRQAPALVSEATTDEALTKLLTGTGITHEFLNERTIVLAAVGTSAAATASRRAATSPSPATGEGRDPRSEKAERLWSRFRLTQATEREGTREAGRVRVAQSESSDTSGKPKETIAEIIVTAQKREERLQDVPISISVIGGVELDTSTNQGINDAIRGIPSVTMHEGVFGGISSVTMRGVGGSQFTGSSPVAFYLDSAPFALVKSAIVPDANAYDMERVEVLRGPQGTLYGANAEAGVIRIITHDADVSDLAFKARVSGSSTEDGGQNYRGDLAVNVPIVEDVLGARLVLGHQDLSGWIDRPNNVDGNTTEVDSARLRLRAEPTQKLTLGWSSWISRTDFDNPALGDENNFNVDVRDSPGHTNFDVHSLQAGYDFSSFTLTTVTSYLEFDNKSTVLFEQFGLPEVAFLTEFESQVFSQEILLNSTESSRLGWTLGAFYRDGEDRLLQALNPPLVPPTDYQNTSESYAVFGQISGHLTPTLEWTAGLRYFHDSVSVEENASQVLPPAPLVSASDDFSAVTPRVSLTWQPTSDVTVYGSYAEGFRSGFPQDPNVTRLYPEIPPAEPETLHNYEIGAHISSFGGRIQIDTAGFYTLWDDVQQQINVRTGPGPADFQTAIVNGRSASGFGVDLDVTVEPIDSLLVGVSVGWNDLRLDEDVFSNEILLFAAGDRLNNSPALTAAASIEYSFSFGGAFEGRFNASARYNDAQEEVSLLGSDPTVSSGDSNHISDARFEVHAPSNWIATLFIDNFTNENPILTEYILHFPSWSTRTRPRTMGLQIEYRF